jgi:putative tryptophan/tyrosine transport system substrate-binding protein
MNGLVASYNRPGGNATGVTATTIRMEGKRLGLLGELVPQAGLIAALVNPNNAGSDVQLDELPRAAQALGRRLEILRASTEREIDLPFQAAAAMRTGG